MLKKEDAIEVAKRLARRNAGQEMVVKELNGNYKVYLRQPGVDVAYVSPDGKVTDVGYEDRIQP